jgi:hypothetical protein
VARFGEFSPNGPLDSFSNISEVANNFWLLFPKYRFCIMTIKGLGYILATFSHTHLVTLVATLEPGVDIMIKIIGKISQRRARKTFF